MAFSQLSPQLQAYLKLDIPTEVKRVSEYVTNNPGCNRNDVCKGLRIGIQSASGRLANAQSFGLISKTDTPREGQSTYVAEPDMKRRAQLAHQRAEDRRCKRANNLVAEYASQMPTSLRKELTAWANQKQFALTNAPNN